MKGRKAGPAGREIDWVGVAVVDSQGLMKVEWAGKGRNSRNAGA